MSVLDIQSAPTIPVELDFLILDSLPSARSREVLVSPINGNSFTVTTSQQILQFDIPCGGSGDYLDHQQRLYTSNQYLLQQVHLE